MPHPSLTTAERRGRSPHRYGRGAVLGGVVPVVVPAVSEVPLAPKPVGASELGVTHAVSCEAVAVAAGGALLCVLGPRFAREEGVEDAGLVMGG